MDSVLEALRRGEAPGRTRKLSATMGGGSNTFADASADAFLSRPLGDVPMIRFIRDRAARAGDEQLASILQNPAQLATVTKSWQPERVRILAQKLQAYADAAPELVKRAGRVARGINRSTPSLSVLAGQGAASAATDSE